MVLLKQKFKKGYAVQSEAMSKKGLLADKPDFGKANSHMKQYLLHLMKLVESLIVQQT